MISKRGEVMTTEGAELPEGYIANVHNSYKFLRISQENRNYDKATRKSATIKHLCRVGQVLRSQLNGQNKI